MIKDKIKLEMQAQKINQTTLCKSTGLTNAQLSNYLSGKKTLTSTNIERIFEALDIQLIKIL